MTAAVADLDWQSGLVVLVVLALILAGGYLIPASWWGPVVTDRLTTTPPALDHLRCVNDDCDTLLCYCNQPDPCRGAISSACSHATPVCDDHRTSDCTECSIDAAYDAGALR